MLSALDFINDHEAAVLNGSVPFQLEIKAKEREEANKREEEHRRFVAEVQAKALEQRPYVAWLEVDMGPDNPKKNLTLLEGRGLQDTVQIFCVENRIDSSYVDKLVRALKARVVHPPPLSLMLGVVTPLGERRVLGIPENANVTVEVGVFCAKYNVTRAQSCDDIQERVRARLHVPSRRILLVLPIDAPDSRKLQLIIREGEQHDLYQFVSDFFEFYNMPRESVGLVVTEVNKRLPAVALQIPVALQSRRQVAIRFSAADNITNVVEGFANFFEIDDMTKVAIYKRAHVGMAPGTMAV